MARPLKLGLEYFSHDVDMSSDPKLELLEAKHELAGYAIYNKLLERIYRNGYFIEWNENVSLILAKRVNVDNNSLSLIIADAVDAGLFDKLKLDAYGVLTNHGIQSRYLKGCARRKRVIFVREYLLVDIVAGKKDGLDVVIVDINGNSPEVNADKSTQSKGKERKGKENKEKQDDTLPSDDGCVFPDASSKPQRTTQAEQLKLRLSGYLNIAIGQADLVDCREKIEEFFLWRMSSKADRRYRTEKGINGLIRDLLDCRKQGWPLDTCLEYTMEREWLTPRVEYLEKIKEFQNKNRYVGMSRRSQENFKACEDFINDCSN